MIVRRLQSLLGTEREVHTPNWVSRRLLLRDDGMGFSLHETTLFAGTETKMWYRNHLEAVYCLSGEGELLDLDTGNSFSIEPGTMYALDKNDKHVLIARTALRMICVFSPPCSGREVHDESGSYPLVESDST